MKNKFYQFYFIHGFILLNDSFVQCSWVIELIDDRGLENKCNKEILIMSIKIIVDVSNTYLLLTVNDDTTVRRIYLATCEDATCYEQIQN